MQTMYNLLACSQRRTFKGIYNKDCAISTGI